ncbi:MAG: desulfoferrodoxin [Rubrivivax sp.]|nr:desulfoferrodoxin [Rubrivivax sp.]
MANLVGKRYVCVKCGAAFIVTRGGQGTVSCCGQPVQPKS